MSIDRGLPDIRISQSLNPYAYVGNDPVNHIDPSDLARIKIWVSAFIEPDTITFPHFFSWPPFVDPEATWHGDDRTFYDGGVRPSARQWHEVVIDTDNIYDSCSVVPFSISPVLLNDAGSGETVVTYYAGPFVLIPTTLRDRASAPDKAEILFDPIGHKITVHLESHGKNPLSPPEITPAIDYEYFFVIYLEEGQILFGGYHDLYPWHEVFLEVDGLRIDRSSLRENPSGPTKSPADLYLEPKNVPYETAQVPLVRF